MKRLKTIKAWGGFCNSRLYWGLPRGYDEPRYAVFRRKRDAKRSYEDVRPVTISFNRAAIMRAKKGK